jgi:methyl-accepting chemotaxis protein
VIYDEDGKVVDVNADAETLFDISDRQIFAREFNDFLPPSQPDGSLSQKKNIELMQKTLHEGQLRHEWLYQRKDGTPVPTDELMSRITLGEKNFVIVFSRDLREFYAAKETEKSAQKKVNEMMEKLNGHLEMQASAISESSAAIEQMVANIRSVSSTLSQNTESVHKLQEASGEGHIGLNEVALDIKEITRESESLLQINAVMENISSQTNLLSMNAAIEAAHAGELGKGFAVVADEIRKLAESSSEHSKTIGDALKNIKSSIDKITDSTENVITKFAAIDSGVKTVFEQESGILSAMTEQETGSAQIIQAINQVNEITHNVRDDARQMIEAAVKIG